MPDVPRAPFDRWPIHYHHAEAHVFAWYIAPATVVIQYLGGQFERAAAEAMTSLTNGIRAAKPHEVAQAGGLTSVHDLRAISGINKDAQTYLQEQWKERRKSDVGATYVVGNIAEQGLLVRVALSALNVVLAFRVGKVMQMVSTIEEALSRANIQGAPLPGSIPGQPPRNEAQVKQ